MNCCMYNKENELKFLNCKSVVSVVLLIILDYMGGGGGVYYSFE